MARSHKKNMQRNTSGSALISAVMIITVLVVLGMGLLALSTVNLKQAKIDNTYERDYYVAEGGAKQGVEAVKNAALESYRQISADIKNGIQTNNNATSFFSALDAVTYVPPTRFLGWRADV